VRSCKRGSVWVAFAVALLALAPLALAPPAAAQYTYIGLGSGSLAGGGTLSDVGAAFGVNDQNQVVVAAGGTGAQSYVWSNGIFTQLPSPGSQYTSVIATAINNDGVVVGHAYGTEPANSQNWGIEHAVAWDPDGQSWTATDLDAFEGEDCMYMSGANPYECDTSNANAVNSTGTVIGYSTDGECSSQNACNDVYQAVEWSGESSDKVDENPNQTEGLAIDDAGDYVITDPSNANDSLLEPADVDLPFVVPGFPSGEGLSHNGDYAIGNVLGSTTQAELWGKSLGSGGADGGVVDLAPLDGFDDSEVFAVNDDGDAVGYSAIPGESACANDHATIWKASDDWAPTDLNSLIPPGTTSTPLMWAYGINDYDDITGVDSTEGCSNPPWLLEEEVGIDSSPPPEGELGVDYSYQPTATGGTPPYQWSIASGSLPPGLTLDVQDGSITGQPTQTGQFAFTLEVEDSSSPALSHTVSLTITVENRPAITSPPAADDGTVGEAYDSGPGEASGGTPPYTWSISEGSLPPGLSLNSSTGDISGTPTTAGNYFYELIVTDSSSPPQQSEPRGAPVSIAAADTGGGQPSGGQPSGGSGARIGQASSSSSTGQLNLSATFGGPGTASVTATAGSGGKAADLAAGARATSFLYGSAHLTVPKAGTYSIKVKPTRRALTLLRKGKTLTVKITVLFIATGSNIHTVRTITVHVHLKGRRHR
jgi:Putative Ig domain